MKKYFILIVLLFVTVNVHASNLNFTEQVTGKTVRELAVYQNYVFVAEGAEVGIYNTADKANITKINTLSRRNYTVQKLFVKGDFLFVGYSQQMRIYNISDINNITVSGGYTYGAKDITALYADDDYIYLSASVVGFCILRIGNLDGSSTECEEVYKNSAYKFSIINVSSNILYASGVALGRLYILDISNKTNPLRLNYHELKHLNNRQLFLSISGIAINGNYVYITTNDQQNPDSSYESNGIYIFNTADFNNPVFTRPRRLNSMARMSGIYIDDGYLYVNEQDNQQIRIYDLVNPEEPEAVAVVKTQSGNLFGAITKNISGNYLYLADNQAGWAIYELIKN